MLKTLVFRNINSLFLILFILSSCGGGGGSGSSETENPEGESLSSPNNPTITVKSSTEIDLSWNSVTGANYYQIYRNTSDVTSTSNKINESTSTKYSDTNLTPNTTYYYWFKACKTGGFCSEFSPTASAKTKLIQPLNDSGITWVGDGVSGNYTTCDISISAPQDCNQGRDAKALANTLTKIGGGVAGFDFTKLGADGSVLSTQNGSWNDNGSEASGTKWSCVRDNHTGLVWEVKNNDGSAPVGGEDTVVNSSNIHHKNNYYHWGGITAIGRDHTSKEGTYYDDWNTLVNGANHNNYSDTTGLCGFTDWRVPTVIELISIFYYKVKDISIDTNYFPNILYGYIWSANPKSRVSSAAWVISMNVRNHVSPVIGYSQRYFGRVRLVRGGVPTYSKEYTPASAASGQIVKPYITNMWPDNRYKLHENGTVTDTYTGLMWKVCSEGQTWSNPATCSGTATALNWQQALERASSSIFAGYDDWRLPNIKELRSLLALDRHFPAINLTIFPNTPQRDYFWTSSPYANSSNYKWYVEFNYVSDGNRSSDYTLKVRLVRAGQ